jgi:hypothetical protein
MARPILTDARISELLKVDKAVTFAPKRGSEKGKHVEWDFDLESNDGVKFTVFVRENSMLDDDFSCGLCWASPSGESVILARYNGGSHPHPNRIEGTKLPMHAHVHRATERYMKAGRPDGYAEPTDLYSNIGGALRSLIQECSISGIESLPGKKKPRNPRQLRLWEN